MSIKRTFFASRRLSASPLPSSQLKYSLLVCFFLIFCGCLSVVFKSTAIHQPLAGKPPSLYSNQLRQDLRWTLIDAIQNATESVHMVMFSISDHAIISALANKKTPTVIHFDANNSPNLWSKLPNANLHPVRGKGLMHQKILILDSETTFIGSSNMTTASLRMHDNLVIGIKNKQIAQFLLSRAPYSTGYLQTAIDEQKIEIWLLPDPKGYALQDLKQKIREAKKSLKIALFTFTHPTLVEEVIQAHKKGMNVRVIVDMHSGLGASKKALEQLQQAGVKISLSRGMQLLHHKFILIDDQTLISGSANWTKSAFSKNSDCFIILSRLTKKQQKQMHTLWTRIEAESQEIKATPCL